MELQGSELNRASVATIENKFSQIPTDFDPVIIGVNLTGSKYFPISPAGCCRYREKTTVCVGVCFSFTLT